VKSDAKKGMGAYPERRTIKPGHFHISNPLGLNVFKLIGRSERADLSLATQSPRGQRISSELSYDFHHFSGSLKNFC